MQFAAAALALLAAAGASTAATVPRADPHVVDFRTYSQPGCSAGNEGVTTITQSQVPSDGCIVFSQLFGSSLAVEALLVGGLSGSCTVTLYSDASCSNGATAARSGQCASNASKWRSFSIDNC